jgi:hypothetical protein
MKKAVPGKDGFRMGLEGLFGLWEERALHIGGKRMAILSTRAGHPWGKADSG